MSFSDEKIDFSSLLEMADENDLEAQTQCGLLYLEGLYGTEIDLTQAIYWFTRAADAGSLNAQMLLSDLYLSGEHMPIDINQALFYFNMAAASGNVRAQAMLGSIYLDDELGKVDFALAHKWLSVAAKQDDAEALYGLYEIYEWGLGQPIDMILANKFLKNAASNGHDQAQYDMGLKYLLGDDDTPQNVVKAFNYMRKSAMQDNLQAIEVLGSLYIDGVGTQKDYSQALYWYEKALAQESSEAQFRLMDIYENGLGVKQDIKKALEYGLAAAKQNHAGAQCLIAQRYLLGQGFKKDTDLALYYYTQSAGQEYPLAYYALASFYSESGPQPDQKMRFDMLKKAAALGVSAAQLELAMAYMEGEGTEQNEKQAFKLLNKFAKTDLSDIPDLWAHGMLILGALYEDGRGVKQDYTKAYFWYEESAKLGNINAIECLKDFEA